MKIDFYVINGVQERDRERFTCRLVEKALSLGHRIQVRTQSEAQSRSLDEMLWTYAQDSFIPHSCDTRDELSPVCISHNELSKTHTDLLINLAQDIAQGIEAFSRISEIVSGDPIQRESARVRFREYRDKGYEVDSHNVG